MINFDHYILKHNIPVKYKIENKCIIIDFKFDKIIQFRPELAMLQLCNVLNY